MKIKLGIIGYGGMGKWHAENAPRAGVEIAAVCDIDEVKQKEAVDAGFKMYQTAEELLKDPLFLLKLGQGLAHSLYRQNLKAATNLSYSAKEQLATHILAVEHQGNFQLELATLADSFGISYRHLLRVIHGFIKAGIISKNKPNYQIINWKQLQDWAVKD